MLFQTHLLLGIVFFLLLKDFFSGGSQIIFFFLVLFGSIFPDIDEAYSKINQWSGFIGRIVTFFSKHRGIFHSIILHLAIFVVVAYFYGVYYGQALFLGFLAHLLGDGITKLGVQVFYPFSKFKIKGPVRVGGWLEGMILLVLIVLVIKELL